jgi:hypothetical protein
VVTVLRFYPVPTVLPYVLADTQERVLGHYGYSDRTFGSVLSFDSPPQSRSVTTKLRTSLFSLHGRYSDNVKCLWVGRGRGDSAALGFDSRVPDLGGPIDESADLATRIGGISFQCGTGPLTPKLPGLTSTWVSGVPPMCVIRGEACGRLGDE